MKVNKPDLYIGIWFTKEDSVVLLPTFHRLGVSGLNLMFLVWVGFLFLK